jgi:hypothetical protein
VKVIHGATGNRFSGNRVLATGFSSILISDSDAEPTGSNAFIKNRIRYTNAFDVVNVAPAIPMHNGIAAIHLMGYTKSNAFQMNEISNPMFTASSSWKGGIFCEWPSPPTARIQCPQRRMPRNEHRRAGVHFDELWNVDG